MKRLLPLLCLLAACVPDIPKSAPPGPTVSVIFDLAATPAKAPAPNDLAKGADGNLSIPPLPACDSNPPPCDTATQTEFNQTYLDTLKGFPFESTAQVQFDGPLDPASVKQGVYVLDVTADAPVTGLSPDYDPASLAIDVPPPAGGWKRGHKFAVAIVAGAQGVQGAAPDHEAVVGSATWALVSAPDPLVQCPSAQSPPADCTLLATAIPATATDPEQKRLIQITEAQALEPIRQAYTADLALIAKQPGAPNTADIQMLWEFSTLDQGEVTFDPANGVVPFPNDILRTGGKVTLPDPTTGGPIDCTKGDAQTQLICGLNTLDGFSTIAAPITENGASTPAVEQAVLGAAASSWPSAQAVGLIPLESNAPMAEQMAPLEYTPCVDCLSSADVNGNVTSPQQLQLRLDAPLTEQTQYLAYVTDQVIDSGGVPVVANPVFALLRLKNPLAVNGKSQVNILTDAQATQLEPLRVATSQLLDALQAATMGAVTRAHVTLAWAFTTQSEGTQLDSLQAYPSSAALQTSIQQGVPLFTPDLLNMYPSAATAAGIPIDAIGSFFIGAFYTPFAVTGPNGVFDLANPKAEPIIFALAIPKASVVPQPASGYPLAIFGHGLTRDRNDFLAIANALAKSGHAVISADAPFHGDRSSCTGSNQYLSAVMGMSLTDDDACAFPNTQRCDEDPLIGRCVARVDSMRSACSGISGDISCFAAHQGLCAADGKCEGGDFARDAGGRPLISGWNIFSLTNFFSTRDNFRQQVIDLSQLVHSLHVTPLDSMIGAKLDLTRIDYVGQSLGGILGTLYNAVSPDTTNVVLNVPGGALVDIIADAPPMGSFATEKALLQAGLAIQSPPILPGTAAYDQFLATAQWVLDPADPANVGWRLTHPVDLGGGVSAPKANRKAFIQFIEDDQTVPNVTNFALLGAAQRPLLGMAPKFNCGTAGSPNLLCYEFTEGVDGFDMTSVPIGGRHGFLLAPPAAANQTPSAQALQLTQTAQTQVATFLATGALP